MKMQSLKVFTAVVALTTPTLAFAQPDYGHGYGPHMMWAGSNWFGMIIGPLIMVLVLPLRLQAQYTSRVGSADHGMGTIRHSPQSPRSTS